MNATAEKTMGVMGVMTLAAMMGAAMGLLMAPRKGSETRQMIGRKLRESKYMAKHKASPMKDKAGARMEEAKNAVAEARSQVEDAVEETNMPRSRRTVSPM